MLSSSVATLPLDKFYIGGNWVVPVSKKTIMVDDSTTGLPFLEVAEAGAEDMDRAVSAASDAFNRGPWPRLSPTERAKYLNRFAEEWEKNIEEVGRYYPREVGTLESTSKVFVAKASEEYRHYSRMHDQFEFDQQMTPTAGGKFALLSHEPVGVVGAIVPWNSPVAAIAHKLAPALMAGCTVVLKMSPEAPVEGYMAARIAEDIGLPAGVLNVVVADREVSELLVTDHRVDKISFTGSTAAGSRIASLCGERIARVNLELGGKSAAIILEDANLQQSAATLAASQCRISGQVCASLTRIVVLREVLDEFVHELTERFRQLRVGDPYDPQSDLGPLASSRQLRRVEGYIQSGMDEGAKLLVGGARPKDLPSGYYMEPTLFLAPDNSLKIAQEEIFGPVMTIIPADSEEHAIQIANDSIFGLNASVFTEDVDRALAVARQIRTGTVGHNAQRADFGIAFGGFKRSGIGREGGVAGLRLYLEQKTIILDEIPTGYVD